MTRGVLYLSGGMQFAENLGEGWRIECGNGIKKIGYTPLDITALDKAYTAAHGQVYLSKDTKNFLQYKSNIRRQFIYTDIRLIKDNSDAVIGYYDESFRRGAGSFAECQAAYDLEKPLFLVSAYPDIVKEVPGWLKALSTRIFTNFEDLYKYLDSLPVGILKIDRYGNHHAKSQYLCSLCGDVFEKSKQHYVSKISPLYCKPCVEVVRKTREDHADRYEFAEHYLDTH
jgi:hypothetical protein